MIDLVIFDIQVLPLDRVFIAIIMFYVMIHHYSVYYETTWLKCSYLYLFTFRRATVKFLIIIIIIIKLYFRPQLIDKIIQIQHCKIYV